MTLDELLEHALRIDAELKNNPDDSEVLLTAEAWREISKILNEKRATRHHQKQWEKEARERQEREKEERRKAREETSRRWRSPFTEDILNEFVNDFFKSQRHGSGFYDYYQRANREEKKTGEEFFQWNDSKPPWYETLGVPREATKSEITKAYRRLAMKFHPDRKPHGDTKKFQEIKAAYEEAIK